MIVSSKEILKKCGYYIEYNFRSEENIAVVNVYWLDNGIFAIRYNPAIKSVCTNWKDQVITGPIEASPSIAWMILKDICDHYKYPMQYVDFKHDNNQKTSFTYDIIRTESEQVKASNIFDLSKDLGTNGVMKENIDLAYKCGIWEGYKAVCEYYLGVNIDYRT